MALDEIGKQIIDNGLLMALKNIRWQVQRQLVVCDRAGNSVKDNPFVSGETLRVNGSKMTAVTYPAIGIDAGIAAVRRQTALLQQELAQQKLLLLPNHEEETGEMTVRLMLPEAFLTELYERGFQSMDLDYAVFRDQIYMKLAQGFALHRTALAQQWGQGQEDWQLPDYRTPKRYVQSAVSGKVPVILRGAAQKQGISCLELPGWKLTPAHPEMVAPMMLRIMAMVAGYVLLTPGVPPDEWEKAARKAQATPASSEQGMRLWSAIEQFATKYGLVDWQGVCHQLLATDESVGNNEWSVEVGIQLQQQADDLAVTLDSNSQALAGAALRQGVDWQIIDASAGLLRVNGQLVKNGVITHNDQAVGVTLSADKEIIKRLVARQAIPVLNGWVVADRHAAQELYPYVQGRALAIKAAETTVMNTTVFRLAPRQDEFITAVNRILTTGHAAYVEEVLPGSCYRALVVNDHICSLVERIPANVVGDGRRTIQELVKVTNQRYPDRVPLHLGKLERETLTRQGLGPTSIPSRGTQVFLRFDATNGTGFQALEAGTSVDESYQQVIVRALNAVGLHDGGVDVIIPNIYQPYAQKPGQFAFLGIHATPQYGMHERVLLQQTPQDIAGRVLTILDKAKSSH
ncbi:hypothetical protein [Ligilactobacillus hohenheimensis]|uniref:hypothetical protein n=1 Tax=Ligilactobacillus hohenheimensis TaxID=2991832 RepID=UPI0024B9A11F|nr:hypothetical protein [Ligilactobacillus hohenheimensis]